MECGRCLASYNLGIHKPMKVCCIVFCYNCLYTSLTQNSFDSSCKICHSAINFNECSPDLSIMNQIMRVSLAKKEKSCQFGLKKSEQIKCFNCECISDLYTQNFGEIFICELCLNFRKIEKSLLEKITCIQGHNFSLLYPNSPISECIICSNLTVPKIKCKKCLTVICSQCSSLLSNLITSVKYLICVCKGDIIWVNHLKHKCIKCKKSNKKIGSFLCIICNKTLCISCAFSQITDLACRTCKNHFNFNSFPRLNYSEGQNPSESLFCVSCSDKDTQEDESLNELIKIDCKGDHDIKGFSSKLIQCSICTCNREGYRCGRCQSHFCLPCYTWISYSEPNLFSKCVKGHIMRKTVISLEFHESEFVSCKFCGVRIKSLTNFCFTCKIDQCEDCSRFLSRRKNIKCVCKGEILYNHFEKCKKCDQCGASFRMSGSFICVTCGFLRCVNCAKEMERAMCIVCGWIKNICDEMVLNRRDCGHSFCQVCIESVKSISCPYDNAPISLHQNFQDNNSCTHRLLSKFCEQASCYFCQKNSKVLWSCLKCLKLFCFHCKIWMHESLFLSNKLTCIKGHNFKLIPSAERLYDRNGKYFCDGCSEKFSGISFHCYNCKIDYCPNCYFKVNTLIDQFEKISCTCNNFFKWVSAKNTKKCSGCSKLFKKSGYFICQGCNKNYCIRCSVKLEDKLRKKQELKEQKFEKNPKIMIGYMHHT